MKETDAKKKWCPMYQVSGTTGGNHVTNRNASGFPYNGQCIGSQCMMWEDWTPPPVKVNNHNQPFWYKLKSDADKDPWVLQGYYQAVEAENDGESGYEIHRISNAAEGDCALKSKEQGCFYPT